MMRTRADRRLQRPWSVLTAALTAGHHGFELSNGIGLVGQPELGLAGAGALWGIQIPVWIALAARGGRRFDGLLAAWSGAALGAVVVHFLLWPWRRSRLGIPLLTEAEGLSASRLPAYNTLLHVWGVASALSLLRDISPRHRRWAVVGLATLPLMRLSATHHFSWLTGQAATNPAWWNSGVQPD